MKPLINEPASSKRSIIYKLFFMMICIAYSFIVNAQQAPPPPGPQPGMKQAPLPLAPDNQQLQQVSTYKGTVAKMNVNDDYVYDGFFCVE